MEKAVTLAGMVRGLDSIAAKYSEWADKADADAKTDKQKASYLSGRGSVFRLAAIDLASLAEMARGEGE